MASGPSPKPAGEPDAAASLPAYLDGLNPEQLSAVLHTGGPLLILAGAGSGKTRVVTTKIAWLIRERGMSPESILAVTFTNKAAKEMAERASRIDERAARATVRTFHSFGAWLLRRNAQVLGLSSNFTIYDDDDSTTLITAAFPDLNRSQSAPYARLISRAKDYCMGPADPELNRISSDERFPEIYAAYQKRLEESGTVDFGDLIMRSVLLLRENPEVRNRIRQRFSVVMVDEYQDSNVAQYLLLRELVGPSTYVCVVGDDDQSIYRFRGAEVKNILTFPESFPGTTIIRLERNYRSTQNILSIATAVVENNEGRLGKTLVAQRPGGGKATIAALWNQDDEASWCARLVMDHRKKGGSYSDVAILYRTNAQSLQFETAFLRLGIPYKVVGSLKFYEREEVKDALSWLSFLLNPRDEVSFRRIINKPARGIGAKSVEKLVETAGGLSAAGDGAPFLSACEEAAGLRPGETLAAKAAAGAKNFVNIVRGLLALVSPAVPVGVPAAAAPETPVESAGIPEKVPGESGNISGSPLNVSSPSIEVNGKPVKVVPLPGKAAGSPAAPPGKKGRKRKAEPAGLASFVQHVVMDSGIAEYHRSQDEIQGSQKVQNLEQLINAASNYPASQEGLTAFLESIALDRSLAIENEDVDGVVLITMHNTKGLEFPVVVITGMEAGLFPREDESDDEREEERRLFYVAITRAKDELYFTSCRERRLWGRLTETGPSPFLSEIPRDLVEVSGGPAAGDSPGYGGAGGWGYGGRGPGSGDGYPGAAGPDPDDARWAEGTAVFSEEYGTGIIVRKWYNNAQLLVEVQFESGRKARLFPKYNKLERISRDGI